MGVSIEREPVCGGVAVLVPLGQAVLQPVLPDEPLNLSRKYLVYRKKIFVLGWTWLRLPSRMMSKTFSVTVLVLGAELLLSWSAASQLPQSCPALARLSTVSTAQSPPHSSSAWNDSATNR